MKTKKQKLKALRKSFREQVLERDGYCCVFCDIKENLDAHHITNRHNLPLDGYVISNGITLCPVHHLIAEKYKMFHDHNVEEFLPDNLYKMINSSYEKALSDCVKLEESECCL